MENSRDGEEVFELNTESCHHDVVRKSRKVPP
jgi:hypothetical protein